MKKSFLSLSLICLFYPLVAQLTIDTTQYLKLERRKGKDFRTLKLKNNNLLVLHNSIEPSKGFSRVLYFYYFDENLDQIWNSTITIPKFSKIVDWRSSAEAAYVLIQSTANHKYKFLKVHLDSDSSHFELTNWKNAFKRFVITTFIIVKNDFLLVGSIDNKPNIIHFDLANKDRPFTVLPSINQLKKTNLHSVYIDHDNEVIMVLLHQAGRVPEKTLYLNQYDFKGRILKNTIVELHRPETLLTFRIVKLKSSVWLVMGTYGYKYQKKAQGMYFFKMEDDKIVRQKFHPFHTFKNIFKDLKPKREANLRNRIARRANTLKSLPYAYHLMFHKLYFHEGEIIALGEIVDLETPSERRESVTLRGRFNYNNPIINRATPPSYVGTYRNANLNLEILNLNSVPVTYYKYKKAFICGFSLEGLLKWDNLFIFSKDTRSFSPQEQITFDLLSDSILFVQNNKIETNYGLQARTQFNAELSLHKLDSTADNRNYDFNFYESGGLKYWFDNHFLGQGVRGYSPEEYRTNRNQGGYGFFYLQKISYRKSAKASPTKFHYIEY